MCSPKPLKAGFWHHKFHSEPCFWRIHYPWPPPSGCSSDIIHHWHWHYHWHYKHFRNGWRQHFSCYGSSWAHHHRWFITPSGVINKHQAASPQKAHCRCTTRIQEAMQSQWSKRHTKTTVRRHEGGHYKGLPKYGWGRCQSSCKVHPGPDMSGDETANDRDGGTSGRVDPRWRHPRGIAGSNGHLQCETPDIWTEGHNCQPLWWSSSDTWMIRMNGKHHVNALQSDESRSTTLNNEVQHMTIDSAVSITGPLWPHDWEMAKRTAWWCVR